MSYPSNLNPKRDLTPDERTKLENDLIKLCDSTTGVRQEKMEEELIAKGDGNISLPDIATAINQLTNQGRLSVFRIDGHCVWRTVAEDKANKLSTMTQHERIVYAAIEKEGNNGIWIKDLRKRTNISGQTSLEKILKGMMVRKLIKSERSVAGKNKKVFMLYDLKPSLEVTGGTWYRGHEMDMDFVFQMSKACTILLTTSGPLTASQVMHQLQIYKITTVAFTLNDVSTVLNTMWMDRQVELVSPQHFFSDKLKSEYLAEKEAKEAAIALREAREKRQLEIQSSGIKEKRQRMSDDDIDIDMESNVSLDEADDDEYDEDDIEDPRIYKVCTEYHYQNQAAMANPCISCPLINSCGTGNLIEPHTCQYLKQWLDESF